MNRFNVRGALLTEYTSKVLLSAMRRAINKEMTMEQAQDHLNYYWYECVAEPRHDDWYYTITPPFETVYVPRYIVRPMLERINDQAFYNHSFVLHPDQSGIIYEVKIKEEA